MQLVAQCSVLRHSYVHRPSRGISKNALIYRIHGRICHHRERLAAAGRVPRTLRISTRGQTTGSGTHVCRQAPRRFWRWRTSIALAVVLGVGVGAAAPAVAQVQAQRTPALPGEQVDAYLAAWSKGDTVAMAAFLDHRPADLTTTAATSLVVGLCRAAARISLPRTGDSSRGREGRRRHREVPRGGRTSPGPSNTTACSRSCAKQPNSVRLRGSPRISFRASPWASTSRSTGPGRDGRRSPPPTERSSPARRRS